jgi:hypothetical protein
MCRLRDVGASADRRHRTRRAPTRPRRRARRQRQPRLAAGCLPGERGRSRHPRAADGGCPSCASRDRTLPSPHAGALARPATLEPSSAQASARPASKGRGHTRHRVSALARSRERSPGRIARTSQTPPLQDDGLTVVRARRRFPLRRRRLAPYTHTNTVTRLHGCLRALGPVGCPRSAFGRRGASSRSRFSDFGNPARRAMCIRTRGFHRPRRPDLAEVDQGLCPADGDPGRTPGAGLTGAPRPTESGR